MKSHIREGKTIDKGMVVCNNCKKEFKANIKTESLGEVSYFGGCKRKYMECSECNSQFNIGFVNQEVTDLLNANAQLLGIDTKQARKNQKKNKKLGLRIMARIENEWRRNNA